MAGGLAVYMQNVFFESLYRLNFIKMISFNCTAVILKKKRTISLTETFYNLILVDVVSIEVQSTKS